MTTSPREEAIAKKERRDRRIAVGLGVIALASAAYLAVREHPIFPQAIADVTNDGIPDMLVFERARGTSRESIGFYNGQKVRSDKQGNYFARGSPIQLSGILLDEGYNYRSEGSITVGEFDDISGSDIVVSMPTDDFPVTFNQKFYNISPAPKTPPKEL